MGLTALFWPLLKAAFIWRGGQLPTIWYTTKILRELRIKNVNRVIIGTLNINSLPEKFEQLKLLIGNYLDILVIQETKLDSSFPKDQFLIEGYTKPYRLDRNRCGGGVMIYVREDIPSKVFNKHTFTYVKFFYHNWVTRSNLI